MRRLVLVALLLAVAAPAATAQPRGRGGGSGAPTVDRKERIKKRIRALRAYTLTDELGLDEATAAKVFPILNKYDDELGKRLIARVKLKQDLAAATGKNDDKATDKAIDDLVANQKALWDMDEKRFAELRKVLTPRQSGRLLVVLPALERKVQNMLSRAMSRGAAPAGRGGRGHTAPDDDDLDDSGDLPGNPYRDR